MPPKKTGGKQKVPDVVYKPLYPVIWDDNLQPEEWLRHPVETKAGDAKFMPPIDGDFKFVKKSKDVFDWLSETVQLNQEVIVREFLRENAQMRAVKNGEVIDVLTSQCYTENTRWVSQSLYGALELYISSNKDLDATAASNTGLVGLLMKVYLQHMDNLVGKKKKYNEKMLESVDKFVQSLGVFMRGIFSSPLVQPTTVGLTIDKTWLAEFNKCMKKTKVYKLFEEVENKNEFTWKQMWWEKGWKKVWMEVERFKTARITEALKKQTDAVVNPSKVDETSLWKMASYLCEKIFKGQKWDTVVLDQDSVAAGICLLELGVGSRVRGIIGVNEIEPVDIRSVEQRQFMNEYESTPMQTVNVRRLTKEKEAKVRAAINMYRAGEDSMKTFDEFLEEEEEDSKNRMVTKPLQYYFFDPMSYSFVSDVKKDRLKAWSQTDPVTHEPMGVFFRLFGEVRRLIRLEAKKTVKNLLWRETTVMVGKQEYKQWSVVPGWERSEEYHKVYQKWYVQAKKEVENSMKAANITTLDYGTHELRRLYVCYSYLIFGARTMKEVAYARRVLLHKSFSVSLFYTSIQINMIVGTTADPAALQSMDVACMVSDQIDKEVGVMLASMKRRFEELDAELSDKLAYIVTFAKKHKPEKEEKEMITHVAFETAEGSYVSIERLKSLRGSVVPADALLQRGKDKMDELIGAGITDASVVQVRKLGVASTIVKDVMLYFKQQVDEA